MEDKQIELDSIWRELGIWGKFQVFQALFLCFNTVCAAFTILAAVFTGYVPNYSCKELHINQTNNTENISYEYDKCEIRTFKTAANVTELVQTEACINGYTYSVASQSTYTAEWDLVCSRSYLPPLAQSLVLAGQGIGAFFMSHLADRFGRKIVQVLSAIGILVSCGLMSLSPNIVMILMLRLVAGTFQQGVVCTRTPMLLEMFPRERRAASQAVFGPSFTIGNMILALFGFIFQDLSWRYLQLTLAAWSIASLAQWWMIDESIRWLLVNGRTEQTRTVLRKAARWNNVEYSKINIILDKIIYKYEHEKDGCEHERNTSAIRLPTINDVTKEDVPISMSTDEDSQTNVIDSKADQITEDYLDGNLASNAQVPRYTFMNILRDRNLRTNTFILWFAWITVTFTYYGLTLVSTRFAGNRFLNFFLVNLVSVPSPFVKWFFVDKIGRKKSIVLFYAVTASSLIIATVLLTKLAHIQAAVITSTVFSLVAKLTISGAFGTMFLYTPEIYPTNYRNRGLGIASSISRIGAMVSPFASGLADIALWIPAAIFGGMCFLVALLALKLPESKYYELPQTLIERQNWDKNERVHILDDEKE